MYENAVTRWFGPHFTTLHPLLQDLHRHGGTLLGDIQVSTGRGLAGWVGRQMLRKMGLTPDAKTFSMQVDIHHDAAGLHWDRRLANGTVVHSLFVPVGHWPEGYWLEHTGPVQLRLTVDVIAGGWYWRLLGLRLHGLPLPLRLMPRVHAFKRIEQGKYQFSVAVVWPLLGRVLAYEGLLTPTTGRLTRDT